MKSTSCLNLLWVICGGFFLTALATAAQIDQKKLMWYDSWVTQYPNDAPPEASIEDPAELKRVLAEMEAAAEARRQAIRKDPEILPYLKAIFWLHHRAAGNNATGGVKSILEAITLKPDLTEGDVADIAAEFDRILATPFTGTDGDSHNYLLAFYAETIIRRFPTKANVERCMRIIQRSNSIDWRFPKFWTLRVLCEIGGPETLGIAGETLAWLESKRSKFFTDDFSHTQPDEAKKRLQAMRERLAATPPAGTPAPTVEISPKVLGNPTPSQSPSPSQTTPPDNNPTSPSLSPLWLASGLLLLPLLFFLLRKKARA